MARSGRTAQGPGRDADSAAFELLDEFGRPGGELILELRAGLEERLLGREELALEHLEPWSVARLDGLFELEDLGVEKLVPGGFERRVVEVLLVEELVVVGVLA